MRSWAQVALPTDADLEATGAADAGEFLLSLEATSPNVYVAILHHLATPPGHTSLTLIPDTHLTGHIAPPACCSNAAYATPPEHGRYQRFLRTHAQHWSKAPRQPVWRCVDHLLHLFERVVALTAGGRASGGAPPGGASASPPSAGRPAVERASSSSSSLGAGLGGGGGLLVSDSQAKTFLRQQKDAGGRRKSMAALAARLATEDGGLSDLEAKLEAVKARPLA